MGHVSLFLVAAQLDLFCMLSLEHVCIRAQEQELVFQTMSRLPGVACLDAPQN